MAVNLSALAGAGQQFFSDAGVPLSGGKLYSYVAGTTTPQTAYTSASGVTPLSNPIILNSAGRVATGEIWLTTGSNYKFILKSSADVIIATWDNIVGINGIPTTFNAANVTYNPAGTGAVATTVQTKLRESVSVKDFGAKGDGVTDDTVAIQAAHAASNQVYYPSGRYLVTMPNNAALVTITSQSQVRITSGSATIYDPRVYTGDPIAPVFDFVSCTDATIQLNYEGATLSSPTTQLGYLGGTFVRWRNKSDTLIINAEITNARYGVLSGSYADTTQGGNQNIQANLRTFMCGYPVALYDVDSVNIEIDADGVHRAAYLAGVQNGVIRAYWKNQYIAPMVVLCTDALVSGPGLKGCKNLDIYSYDKGSTVFQNASACCGLSPSRNTYPVTHSNLRYRFGVTSTDTISTKVGGFTLGGGSGPLPSNPYNWEQTTVLENITVSGVIDRSGQTLDSSTAGDVYWNSNDTGTHYATVRNILFENITIIPSSGTTRNCYFIAPGLEDLVRFANFVSSGAVGIRMAYQATAKAVFDTCVLPSFVQEGTVGSLDFYSTTVASVPSALTVSGVPTTAASLNGAGMTLRYKETVLTLTGASTTWTNPIPLGAVLMGCVSRIQTTITGATGYLLGTGALTSLWANTNNLTAGLSTTVANYSAAALTPTVYQIATSIVVTAKTSNFTAGELKIGIFYFDTTGPTQ